MTGLVPMSIHVKIKRYGPFGSEQGLYTYRLYTLYRPFFVQGWAMPIAPSAKNAVSAASRRVVARRI